MRQERQRGTEEGRGTPPLASNTPAPNSTRLTPKSMKLTCMGSAPSTSRQITTATDRSPNGTHNSTRLTPKSIDLHGFCTFNIPPNHHCHRPEPQVNLSEPAHPLIFRHGSDSTTVHDFYLDTSLI